ncbi:unnamed protein product (macronuclear) [Paramecium tetraurelia]|uniref:Uncharacterized protein n=1 Tax=Paramecium tetraurelia TaxID=5888 RepID=A0C4N6_PARTE|nr:uncharacterized protein GSPATT00006252001 [Paramecium tetraurelia]CAK65753.1 unnamed protein product [Paramecium tetraurelia]|eukprot:XP_001433150.1 hypothetical protein (macronuclear) [Paramecium tetraurelia strain d4-2]
MKPEQENESTDELSQLREEKARRRQKKEYELQLMGKCIVWLIYAYVAGLIITTINYILHIKLEKEFQYEGIIEDNCQDLKILKNINDQIFPLLDELTVINYSLSLKVQKVFQNLSSKFGERLSFWNW